MAFTRLLPLIASSFSLVLLYNRPQPYFLPSICRHPLLLQPRWLKGWLQVLGLSPDFLRHMRTLRVSAAAPKHSIPAAARPESPPCYQLSPCIIIVHFFSTESGMMKLIGFMLGTDVLPSAQMLRVAPSCWCSSPVRFFCTFS